MRTVAIIIARMGSTRLPGKVLMELGGKRVLDWVIAAASMAPGVDAVVVATTTETRDDMIVEACADLGIGYSRGLETDVLDRVYHAALANQADVIVRITGDCPFVDPMVIGEVVRLQHATGCAYASNVAPRTWPDGLDTEAFTIEALEAAHKEATRPIDRECVTTWIARNRSRFPAQNVTCPIPDLHRERWVLDTPEDYEFCKQIASRLGRNPASYLDILTILDENPQLRNINAAYSANERYFDAVAKEPVYGRSVERSQGASARARRIIPLGAQTFSKSYLQYPQPSPLFLSHGYGGIVWDIDGGEYVDCVGALLPNVLGYCDPDIDRAIRHQLDSGISLSLSTELEAELAERLNSHIPSAEMIRFGKTGTDATTAAVRLARAYTGRLDILICGGYHGWADWSVERNFGVLQQWNSIRIPFGEPAAAYHLGQCNYAACIVEPERNPEGYLQLLREECDRTHTVLIFDEIITWPRFGLGGAQEFYGVTPDLTCISKAMANGMPISAIMGRQEIMKLMAPPEPNVFFSGTFFGEALSLAAAIATIDKLEAEDVPAKLRAKGLRLILSILPLVVKHGLSDEEIMFTGDQALIRIMFKHNAMRALFQREMLRNGVLIIASHNLCYAHTDGDLIRMVKAYDNTFSAMRQAIDKGEVIEPVTATVRG